MTNHTTQGALGRLAKLHGVQTSYFDVEGKEKIASPEALLAVLQALGVPIQGLEGVGEALRVGGSARWRRRVPRVAVAWEGRGVGLEIRLPRAEASGRARCTLALEQGGSRQWTVDLEYLPVIVSSDVEGIEHVALRLDISAGVVPTGYHDLQVVIGGVEQETLIICAPQKVYRPARSGQHRAWGLFAPVYALRSEDGWGAGDFSDLRRLMDLGEPLGASTFAILPLLATFLGEAGIYEHSPYMPVSRLFWNEMYVDPAGIPELAESREARELIASSEFQARAARLRERGLIDHGGVMALKREVLQRLSSRFFERAGRRRAEFDAFVERRGDVREYAAFRAACERHNASWWNWTESEREGRLDDGDMVSASSRYHQYAQWIMDEQLTRLAERARRAGDGLYLDLPLGVHPDGYDAWRERDAFALAATAGAPPDPFFTKGQNWGFPPLDPAGIREQKHSYFIATIRNHLAYAGVLRVDHVMGLHRLFWVPRGFEPSEGVYVGYPAEEFWAILCLESHRTKTRIVGENLGTVPDYVNEEMDRRAAQRMYVGQFAMSTIPSEGLLPPPRGSLASINTHDTPTFAAFWREHDIAERLRMGFLSEEAAEHERDIRRRQREAVVAWLRERGETVTPEAETPSTVVEEDQVGASPGDEALFSVLRGLLGALADSEAEGLLVTLEDLWLELLPQNVPGTYQEFPNWQRRMRKTIDEVFGMEHLLGALQEIDRRRKKQEGSHG